MLSPILGDFGPLICMKRLLSALLYLLVLAFPLSARIDNPDDFFDEAQGLCVSGRYAEAIDMLTRLYDEVDSDQDQLSLKARAAMQIGIIYFFMQDYDSALLYYEKARAGAEQMGSVTGVSTACINIGNIYQIRGDFYKALELYNQSLSYHEENGDIDIIASAKFNIASCYEDMGREKDAYDGYCEASDLAAQGTDRETESVSLLNMALFESTHGMMEKGESHIHRSIEIAEENDMLQVLHQANLVHMKMYEESGDYRSAYETSLKVQALADSLFRAESMEQLNEFQVKYDTREKEAQIEIQNAVIKNERKVIVLVLLAAVLLGGIAFMQFRYRALERRRRQMLEEINATKDTFYSIISHDLKNPVNAQNNALRMMNENFDLLPADVIRQECSELHKSSESLKELLENLLAWSRMQTGRMKVEPVRMDISSVIIDVEKILHKQLTAKNIVFNVIVPEGASAEADLNMVSTVLRNVATNALKFTPEGGRIDVSAKDENPYWRISVVDTGTGMSQETIDALLGNGSVASLRGTSGESGTGLGMIVCRDMIARNGGNLSISSKPGAGTEVSFTIKKV